MNTIFLPKEIQEALEAILKEGKFTPCEGGKQENEKSLGFLTNEQKALWSFRNQLAEKHDTLVKELKEMPCCCPNCCEEMSEESEKKLQEETRQKTEKIGKISSDHDFIDKLFWKNVREIYPDPDIIGIREGWEVVEVLKTEEEKLVSKLLGSSSLGKMIYGIIGRRG